MQSFRKNSNSFSYRHNHPSDPSGLAGPEPMKPIRTTVSCLMQMSPQSVQVSVVVHLVHTLTSVMENFKNQYIIGKNLILEKEHTRTSREYQLYILDSNFKL